VDWNVTADRIPPGELDRVIARLGELGEPVDAFEIADYFDVPLDVAELALRERKQRLGIR
jgi:hypothetical protein